MNKPMQLISLYDVVTDEDYGCYTTCSKCLDEIVGKSREDVATKAIFAGWISDGGNYRLCRKCAEDESDEN